MLNKKLKIISLITLLLISLLAPIVSAENEVSNETTSAEQVNPISETQQEITIKEGDEYLLQENVTIDTPIDGNLFIMASTVTINTQIGGDAFILADTINVEEDGYILNNLFACADTINLKGVAYNVYSIGSTLTIDGFVYRDVRSICNTLNINSMIGRNVFVDCSSINFKEKPDTDDTPSIASYGTIQGDLNYSSREEITIPDDCVVGETYFTALNSNKIDISNYMYSLGAILVSTIILWLIGLWISPKLLHNTCHPLTLRKVLKIIGLGILVPIIITLLSVIILLIPITSQLTILLLCVLAILFFISTSVTLININAIICNKLKITQNLHKLGFLIVTAIIFWLLTLIPYVGTIISLLAIIWGIGTVSYSILIKEKSDEIHSNSDKKISDSKEKKKDVETKKEIGSDKSANAKKENNSNDTEKNQKQNQETDKNKDNESK